MPGRPLKHRAALARAFLAKMVFDISTTRALLERVRSDPKLRRLCGWERLCDVPSEATVTRAFREFAEAALPARMHEALIKAGYAKQIVGHISRDATAIEAREKPAPKKKKPERPKRKRGRPRKGEERPKEPTRLERPRAMSLEEMLCALPKECAVGVKRNAKGVKESWVGYKLHMDVADGGIPISCMVSSASLHDSQAAIPLATMTAARVRNLYYLMDSAYDAEEIRAQSASLDHVPIIDDNPRTAIGKEERCREVKAQRANGFVPPQRARFKERSTVERAFGRLKHEFGGRHVRVRSHQKVTCHLMFGVLALTVDQLLRLLHRTRPFSPWLRVLSFLSSRSQGPLCARRRHCDRNPPRRDHMGGGWPICSEGDDATVSVTRVIRATCTEPSCSAHRYRQLLWVVLQEALLSSEFLYLA